MLTANIEESGPVSEQQPETRLQTPPPADGNDAAVASSETRTSARRSQRKTTVKTYNVNEINTNSNGEVTPKRKRTPKKKDDAGEGTSSTETSDPSGKATEAQPADEESTESKALPHIGLTLNVKNGVISSVDPKNGEIYVAKPSDDDEEDESPHDAANGVTDPTAAATEAWLNYQGWPPEYREMYANAAAANYGDFARQWGAYGGYPYPLQHPHFAQFGHAGYYGQPYTAESWQQYQAAAAAHQMQQQGGNTGGRSRKRTTKTNEDGEEFDENDGEERKSRKTRPNFSKDVIALLTTWILTHYDNPYPQKDVKQRMQEQTGLSELQLDNWFSNARRRLLVKDETTKRYSIANRAPKKRGPKSKKEGDSDFEEGG
ncbi:hypothetical protein HK098_007418 [Nowakowskiella sp. JEL0407]|nr:hypothetical protein HK098_007418 [Nowakowskiella sp. JEL0407]